jgi:hypothetical protein
MFWDITPCSPLKVNRRFREIYGIHVQVRRMSLERKQCESRALFATCFTLVYCSAYSSTLNVDAIYSSETSVDFQRTTQRYILEGSTFNTTRYIYIC